MEPGWQAALGRPHGDKGSETSHLLDSYTRLWAEAGLEYVVQGQAHVICATSAPTRWACGRCALHASEHRKGTEALPREWLLPGWAGGKASPDTAQTLQRSHSPYHGPGWQHRQKHQHPRAGGASFPTETCKQSSSYNILFSHRIPQGGIYQDVTQEVVFVWLVGCFFFPWKFESTTLSPIIRHCRGRKQRSPKGRQSCGWQGWLQDLED